MEEGRNGQNHQKLIVDGSFLCYFATQRMTLGSILALVLTKREASRLRRKTKGKLSVGIYRGEINSDVKGSVHVMV